MKLSIITINLNHAGGLQRTFRSIIEQSFQDFEYILIDGDSNDGSIEVIDSFRHRINHMLVEGDSGIYNAMNKGIQLASGDYLLFLNSGDALYSNKTLKSIIPNLRNEKIIYGDLIWRDGLRTCYPSHLQFSFLKKRSLPHQASFIKKEVFDHVGLYDENLRITGDWKFFLSAICKFNVSYKKIDQIIAIQEPGGISDSVNRNIGVEILKEKYSVLTKEFETFTEDYKDLERINSRLAPMKIKFWKRYFSKYRKSTAVSKYDW